MRQRPRLLLPLSLLFASRAYSQWTSRVLWLLLPLEIFLSQELLRSAQAASLYAYLVLFVTKFAVVLVFAGLLFLFLGRFLCVDDGETGKRTTRPARFGHICFWLMLVWLLALAIWLALELLLNVVSGTEKYANIASMFYIKGWVALPPLENTYGAWKSGNFSNGYFWGWYLPVAAFIGLAVLAMSAIEWAMQPGRRLYSLLELPFIVLLAVCFALPHAAINSSAFCEVFPEEDKTGAVNCTIAKQLSLAWNARWSEPPVQKPAPQSPDGFDPSD